MTLLTVRRAATGFALVAALSSPLQRTGDGSALGAIVPTYNVPDTSSQLKFTGDTLSGIYMGDIQKWNDPRLSAGSPQWATQIGKDTAVQWPVGLGAAGNPGVAGEVLQPSLASVTAAAASASSTVPSDLCFSIVNAPGQDAYPISTATWLLTYREVGDRAQGLALTRMLRWATHDGQQFNNALAYATVPPELTTRSEEFIREMTFQGKPIFPGQ